MENSGGGLIGILFMLIMLAIALACIAGSWKMFVKAGKPGWACLVPIYNLFVMLEIVGRPLWWIILWIIPVVNFVIFILVSIDLAKSFGKDRLYGIGIILLGFIFIPMLGFGDARYQGPAAA